MGAVQPRVQSALVIESHEGRGEELLEAIRGLGVEAELVPEAEEGWRRFARRRPDAVFAARHTSGRGGDWFLRRLQTEFMGQMPAVYLTCAAEELEGGPALEPDGIIVPPLSFAALESILGTQRQIGDTAARQATRLRELYELSLLGGDFLRALDTLVARTALTFQVSDCVLWGNTSDSHWPRTARKLGSPEAEEDLLWRCRLAVKAGVTLLAADAQPGDGMVVDRPGKAFLAAPLGHSQRADVGAMCLVDDDSHRFSPEERDALRVLARRVSSEIAWVTAHNRLVAEHEKLRETALVDPLLGVWTRSALEQAIEGEIAASRRRGEPLTLAVLDYVGLRAINDRYSHVTGDAVLGHFAETLQTHLRSQDLIGRFGGDELAVLLVGADLSAATRLMEHLLEIFEESPFDLRGLELKLQVTIGLTRVMRDETGGEPAFARALGAMRRARRQRLLMLASDPEEEYVSEESQVIDLGTSEVLPAGSTLGGMYRILHEISRGAMGVVYRGEDLGLGRPVAIKVLRSDLASNQELVSRFRSEASMLASLHHNNLVQVYSFGQEGDEVFFVMELVEGEPLSDVIARLETTNDSIGYEAVSKVVEEIADALDAVHSVGIIHRDVKPANVLLDRINDRAVLVDVGVAKKREDTGDAAGTPGFAAPESFMEAAETPPTDVYGLAATAYTMLTSVAPFGSGEVVDVVHRQLFDEPPAPSSLRPVLPRAVDEVLARALAPKPEDRYRAASAFAIALSRALERRPAETEARPPRRKRRFTDRVSFPDGDHPISTRELAAPVGIEQAPPSDHPHIRGAVFRVAYKMLGHRLGSGWLQEQASEDPELGALLRPTLPPTSWQPLRHVVALLDRARPLAGAPEDLARALGRDTITATFTRFFGADPRTMAPAAVLKAAEGYWSRYHNWGRVSVTEPGEDTVVVSVEDAPREPLVCALIEGSLGRIAELAGAREVHTAHPECRARGGSCCRFSVSWERLTRAGHPC